MPPNCTGSLLQLTDVYWALLGNGKPENKSFSQPDHYSHDLVVSMWQTVAGLDSGGEKGEHSLWARA